MMSILTSPLLSAKQRLIIAFGFQSKLNCLGLYSCMTLFLISCTSIKDIEYQDFQNFSITTIGFSSSTLKTDLVYYNPNSFGLQLKSTDLDIYINDNFVGHTSQEYQINIQKRSIFSIPLQMEVDMKNLFKNTYYTIISKKVTVKVVRMIKIGKANVFKSFPVNYQGEQEFKIF